MLACAYETTAPGAVAPTGLVLFGFGSPRADVLGYSQPELSKLAEHEGARASKLLQRLQRACDDGNQVVVDSAREHQRIYFHSATALHGSAHLPFVIPSEAEGSAVRLHGKQRPFECVRKSCLHSL